MVRSGGNLCTSPLFCCDPNTALKTAPSEPKDIIETLTMLIAKTIKNAYEDQRLYRQQIRNFRMEKYREDHNRRFLSWDFHMALTLRYFDLYGIAPKYNQIRNIGIDEYSTHGGTSKKKPNTAKFCEIETHPLPKELKGPDKVMVNKMFEKNFTNIILVPLYIRTLFPLITFTKKVLRMYPDKSFINK